MPATGSGLSPHSAGITLLEDDIAKAKKGWSSDYKRMTTLGTLCVIAMIKGADIQLLPSSFRAMEVDLKLKPHALGVLALCQGVCCAAAGPAWGNLVDSGCSRKLLLAMGAGAWGACTFSLAFVSNFALMASLRACNGVALAMMLPVTQSFIVDLSEKADRGYIFGWIFFFANLGQVLACLFVTPMSNEEVMGMAGWRFALAVVGAVSCLFVFLVPVFVFEEPRIWMPERFGIMREFRKLDQFMRIPTFAVMIAQGVFGTIPGAALTFTTMYFQYIGLSDSLCALINSLRIVGDACGGLVGGLVGDKLHRYSPSYGRAATAQISVCLSLPFVFLIFMAIPRDEEMLATYAGLLFLHGFVGAWVTPGCICPIMCEIVPRRCLSSAYAWELALVFCSGNTLGPVLVGLMSQRLFGYNLSTKQVDDMSSTTRSENARALGKALFFTCALPYACCAALFSLLYFTYPVDSRAAQESDFSDGSLATEDRERGTSSTPKCTSRSRLIGRRTTSGSTSEVRDHGAC